MNLNEDDSQLNKAFEQYRWACPDFEPGPNFMPQLWDKIEGKRGGLWLNFSRLGRNALAVSGALCLLLLGLNLTMPPQVGSSYTDALISAGSAEQVDFSEAIWPVPSDHPGSQTK